MLFVLGTVVIVLFIVGVLVVVGHFYPAATPSWSTGSRPARPRLEVQNEIDDVRQMVEAQNEMRRRRGAPELDEGELRDEVAAEELERLRWPDRGSRSDA